MEGLFVNSFHQYHGAVQTHQVSNYFVMGWFPHLIVQQYLYNVKQTEKHGNYRVSLEGLYIPYYYVILHISHDFSIVFQS